MTSLSKEQHVVHTRLEFVPVVVVVKIPVSFVERAVSDVSKDRRAFSSSGPSSLRILESSTACKP